MLNELDLNIFNKKFLSRTTSIEFVINEKCQNACTYCYRKYKHDTSSVFSITAEELSILIKRFLKITNQTADFFKERHVELFGGDPLIDYQETINIIKLIDKYKPKRIVIPTNGRLVSELTDYDLNNLLNCTDTPVSLSLSIDGDPSENNRPLSKIGKMLAYEEKINYEKLYKSARKYNCGFHPMLSFRKINKWLETIKFFYDQFSVVPYLLEVRHPLPKEDAIHAVIQLAKIRYYYQKNISSDLKIIKQANTISASRTPRGLGCSALTTIVIMPNGDLPFCHRVVDKPWTYGNVNTKLDVSKAISLHTIYNHRNVPDCFVCPIRTSCSGLCQGACYEYWGDPWIPIRSICNYFRLKSLIFYEHFDDWKGMLNSIGKINELKQSVYKTFGKDIVEKINENISKE